jgi:hypothetical protein
VNRTQLSVLVLTVFLNALYGPAVALGSMPDNAFTDAGYWTDLAAEFVRGLGTGIVAVAAFLAATYGIEIRNQRRQASQSNNETVK